jgi:hypothetical protein
MKLDPSLSRKRITAAISSGLPGRPSGAVSTTSRLVSGGRARAISVSISPGRRS